MLDTYKGKLLISIDLSNDKSNYNLAKFNNINEEELFNILNINDNRDIYENLNDEIIKNVNNNAIKMIDLPFSGWHIGVGTDGTFAGLVAYWYYDDIKDQINPNDIGSIGHNRFDFHMFRFDSEDLFNNEGENYAHFLNNILKINDVK